MTDTLVVDWELEHVAGLGLLESGEVICEAQEAWKKTGWGRGRLGAIVVTDLRILFVSTTGFRRRSRIDAFPLTDIVAVETADSMWDDRGAIRVHVDVGGHRTSVMFERIPGGRARAEEVVRSIERQRSYLHKPGHP